MPLPHVHISPPEEEGGKVRLTFGDGDQAASMELDLTQLSELIGALGAVRASMAGSAVPPIEGARFSPVRHTSWALQPDTDTDGSVFAFQHPAWGAVGLVFNADDAERVVKALQIHRSFTSASAPDQTRLN
ncbi:hypothetical protein LOC54_08350 [Acetobacter sp. AN02]|uniref:hypothetical protein n=1 Tax=Acetobacter sp. AN02 TaxID=2894186 RepID=UPI0024344B24|nr:hypothetical protein [Acetobacter sp. AN02]MDG6095120.1 hypothetical protein [Acetobacter sp. AN02]